MQVQNQSLLDDAEQEERGAIEKMKGQKAAVKAEGRAWKEEYKQLQQRLADRVGLLLDHRQRTSEMVASVRAGVAAEAESVQALHTEIDGVVLDLGLPA